VELLLILPLGPSQSLLDEITNGSHAFFLSFIYKKNQKGVAENLFRVGVYSI